jgi:hypothetical protein
MIEAVKLNRQAKKTKKKKKNVCLSKIYELINYDFSYRILLINEFENILINYGILYSDVLFTKSTNIVSQIENLIENYFNSKFKILLECFIILIDFYKKDFFFFFLVGKWFKIKELVKSLPISSKKVMAMQEDARYTSFPDSIVNFIITSPPYINVFNYHQQYRSSSEYLNGSVLSTAKAEIGSNRKNRGNRFFTVVQYCIDMALVFIELNRICKENSRIIFIVGRESAVRKTNFRNGEIVTEIACKCCGLRIVNKQERVFINRYGINIYEDILHFISSKNISDPIQEVKEVAYLLLQSVVSSAPDESQLDLKDAIENIDDIEQSPLYQKKELVRSENEYPNFTW